MAKCTILSISTSHIISVDYKQMAKCTILSLSTSHIISVSYKQMWPSVLS